MFVHNRELMGTSAPLQAPGSTVRMGSADPLVRYSPASRYSVSQLLQYLLIPPELGNTRRCYSFLQATASFLSAK